MNKPVLFLDFDGPLFPERQIRHSRSIEEYPGKQKLHSWITYWEMDLTSVRQLNSLYKIYQFDTVVSSSWKHYCDKDQIEELFEANGLNLPLHEDWCTPSRMSSYRINDICWWLDEYTEERDGEYFCPAHMILDDPWSGSYLEGYKGHGVTKPYMIDPDVGIDSAIYKIMKSDVNSWRDDHTTREFKRVFPTRDWDGIIPVLR